MDMDWLPVISAAAAGMFTLSGVGVTAWVSASSDKRRLAIETHSEAQRQRREDEAEARLAKQTQQAEDSAVGKEVADIWLGGLRDVRDYSEMSEEGFIAYFRSKWSTRLELSLRPVIGRIRGEDERARFRVVMEALDDFDELARAKDIAARSYAEDLFILGVDLGLTIARAQQPDSDMQYRYGMVAADVEGLQQHRDLQREMEYEHRRAGQALDGIDELQL